MRKIEREMLEAIHEGRNWQKDNTAVTFDESGDGAVYLYGHCIARLERRDGYAIGTAPWFLVRPDIDTCNHWPTTKGSRLHALGVANKADQGSGHEWINPAPVPVRKPDANA